MIIPFPDGTLREYPNGTMLWPIFPKKIIIEPVYGCDKKCGFCSLASIDDSHNIKCMTEELFYNRILEPLKIEKLNVINLSGIGEPTMHPLYFDFVSAFHKTFPSASIKTYTNGYLFRQAGDLSALQKMMDAGLSLILIDCYDKQTLDIVEKDKEKFGIVNCYDENVFSNSSKTVVAYNPPDQALFVNCTQIRRPDTQGGLLPFENWERYKIDGSIFPVMKRCNKATKSMHIMYDGHVNMCCADNSRSFWMGTLNEQSPREIWQSKDFDMVRYAMFRGWRNLIPTCWTCDRRSFRVGLYPHAGGEYTQNEIMTMAKERFTPIPEFVRNIRMFDEKFHITNPLLRSMIDGK